MNKIAQFLLLSLLLGLLPACEYVFYARPPDDEHGAPPRLFVMSDSIDLGSAVSGDAVKRTIMVRNIGGTPLRIFSSETSCGCTVVSFDRTSIPAGKSTNLDVLIDTAGKVGPIEKALTLRSNDPVEPEKAITLRLFVDSPSHEGFDIKSSSIFQGECKRCHVNPGIGTRGATLFDASCAMCHRSKDAKHSPGTPVEVLRALDAQELESSIRRGKKGTSMPGFHEETGGPLSTAEVESLIRYLKGGP